MPSVPEARYVADASWEDAVEHNLIAQAINEVFLDRGENHPVAYLQLPSLPDG